MGSQPYFHPSVRPSVPSLMWYNFFSLTVTTIYAIEANNVREINFPLETKDHWSRTGDVLSMPAEALRENSDGGLVRLVCFAYNNLEHVCFTRLYLSRISCM